jgi:branched-chain amino acid transport system permease protein
VSLEALRDLYFTYESVAAFIGLNGLLALSVYATLSCGQLSLANAGFMALGSYAAALLALHTAWSFPATLLAAAALPALVAVPLGLPVLRLRGVFLAIATIGFGEVVRIGFVNWDFTNGAQGLVGIPQRAGLGSIYACVALALFVFWRLKGSRPGMALESIREDEAAARTMGIDTTRYKLSMLALGAALAGLAGGLEAQYTFVVVPSGFAFGKVVDMLVYAVVGGTRSIFGPVIGAAFLTVLPEVLREVGPKVGLPPGPLRLFVNGTVLLLVILFLPNGIVSLPSRWREWRSSRRSARAAAAS